MTPKRKKYLDGISCEEQAIRSELYSEEIRLSDLKWNVKFSPYEDVRTTSLELIKETKIIIKALKKQLPASAEMEYDQEYICPICNTITQAPYKSLHEMFYCPYCGQKLR